MNTLSKKNNLHLKSLGLLLILLLASLSCKAVTGAFTPATSIPAPAATIESAATQPPADADTATAPPTTNSAGVRACYYVPGQSVPAQMPPEVLATPTPYIYPTTTPLPVTRVDAATTERQLAVFRALWQDVNDNYVYTDFNGLDWKAIGDRYEALIKKGLSDDDFYNAMSTMIFELGDEHSGFLSPTRVKEDQDRLAGRRNFVGIGAMVLPLDEDYNGGVIITVFADSPAAEGGLRPHDKILGVDGGPWFDQEAGQSRTLGPEGTQVTITIQRPGEAAHDITLTRRAISSSLPIDYCLVPTTRIGYIFLPSFYDETIDDQVREALTKMTADGPLSGLIIDNRMNGGGISTVANPILGFFTEGVQGYFVSRTDRRPLQIEGEDINGSQSVPLVILVDVGSVSYGEIFSGVLRIAGRATIVGQNTLGNVEVMYRHEYEDGSEALIASATFEPVGAAAGIWERTGIIPDVLVPTRWDLFTEATDPALAKAVELLTKGK